MIQRLENINKANKGRKENKTKRSKDYSNHIWSLPGGIEECPVCDELHKWKDQTTGKDNTCYRLSNCPTFANLNVNECAEYIKKLQGCVICIDRLGTH